MKLNDSFFKQLISDAAKSDRKRSHHNLHQAFDEPVQRLCIALKKGTYVRPHHHPQANKWELIIGLRGSVGLVIFDAQGVVVDKEVLHPGDSMSGIEMTANTWHTAYPITDDAVILEVKEGPYTPATESDFAQWAPREGDASVDEFLIWIQRAQIGDSYLPAS